MTGTAAAAAALSRLLAPGQDIPIEHGAAAVFESIAGSQIRAVVRCTGRHELNGAERAALQARDGDAACRREGRLRTAGGVLVAEVTAVLLPRRIPPPARQALGITPTGAARDGLLHVPLGRALRGLSVRRQQLEVTLTPGCLGDDGAAVVLYSRALLQVSLPVALVTERVYLGFLEAFPLPWPAALAAAQATSRGPGPD